MAVDEKSVLGQNSLERYAVLRTYFNSTCCTARNRRLQR